MSRAMTKICAECASFFARDPRYSRAYWERQKYCSRLCFANAHSRQAAATRASIADVFEKWIDRTDDCWLWRGAIDRDGYGAFSYACKMYRAPVMALLLDGRPVPRGMYACHHCDNPPCVNPAHLYVGTPKQNSADAKRRGRMVYGRKAKLTEADVVAIRNAVGTHKAIATRFGVTPSNVTMIRNYKTWAHVP